MNDLRLRYIDTNVIHGDERDVYNLLNSKCKRSLDNLCLFIHKGLKQIIKYYDSLKEAGLLHVGATGAGIRPPH